MVMPVKLPSARGRSSAIVQPLVPPNDVPPSMSGNVTPVLSFGKIEHVLGRPVGKLNRLLEVKLVRRILPALPIIMFSEKIRKVRRT